jgi:hypothetical protein
MPKQRISVVKPEIKWIVKFFFNRYRLKKYYTSIYFLPTLQYVRNHDEDFFDPCLYDKWTVTLKFAIFGFGIIVTKETL